MQIKNHRLVNDDGGPIDFRKTPNVSKGTIQPKYLIIHYTAGASAESSINWLCDKKAKASAHLVIGRDGSITQLANFNRRTWHAGKSEWRGIEGLNGCSIGIEIDNPGPLKQSAVGWQTSWGRKVADEDVILATHKHQPGVVGGWHGYTEAQLAAVEDVAVALAQKYSLVDVLGHEDIAPNRKTDPGPAFDLARLRGKAFGRSDQEDINNPQSNERVETITALNIRSGPSTSHEKLAASPLAQGTVLHIMSRIDPWCEVEVLSQSGTPELLGWVHGKYVRDIV